MNGINIKENSGHLYLGNNNVFNITCHCGANCYGPIRDVTSIQNVSDSDDAKERLPQRCQDVTMFRPDVDRTRSKLCLCAIYQQDNQIVVENPLSKCVTDLIRNNSCTHFEIRVNVQSCVLCEGKTIRTSDEFQCTFSCPIASVKNENPLQLRKVTSPFQAFLDKSQDIIKKEGSCIRIISNICENGKKVRIKLRFDVRKSMRRRSKSFSNLSLLKNETVEEGSDQQEGSGSLKGSLRMSKSNSCLDKRQSTITILDGEVNVHEHENSKSILDEQVTVINRVEGYELDESDGLNLNELEKEEVFATGKFGPLYKVSRYGRQQLVKVVEIGNDNQHFLKEAKRFMKCRHPYVRPTADVIEQNERCFVFYWFLAGPSLFEAIEDNHINHYVLYCRIVYGIVKGLMYLQRVGIVCDYLTPEKVLLDVNFNPRISGVGKSYFNDTSGDNERTNDGNFHRSLSYLDCHLRSRKQGHLKNVLWSVGRCIWDMLLGKICQRPGEPDLLAQYKFFACLDQRCNDYYIKTVYFNDSLRKNVYAAGWPRDKEVTKLLVVCAVRCMLLDLDERLSLEKLNDMLENEMLSELQGKAKLPLYEYSDNLCLYCLKNERDTLRLTCDCTTACNECLRNNSELYCPEHGMHSSTIGHKQTYGFIIQGEFHENVSICENDSVVMESLLTDQTVFSVNNFKRVKSKSQDQATNELKRITTKIMDSRKKNPECLQKHPTTLLLYITGHCNDAGSLILSDGSVLKKKTLVGFIKDINPKNLIVLANGHYSEKLVKNLSQARKSYYFTNSHKFFGVFSHAGNMCEMTHKDISDENSIVVKFILDILRNDQVAPGSNVNTRYLTASGLADEISRRTHEKFNKRLKPIDHCGGHIPIAYISNYNIKL